MEVNPLQFRGIYTLLPITIDCFCYHELQMTEKLHFTSPIITVSPPEPIRNVYDEINALKCQIKWLFCFLERKKSFFFSSTWIRKSFVSSLDLFLSSTDFQQQKAALLSGYDTGIGSTTTIGSPQPICRSQVKTNGCFANYMQVSRELQISSNLLTLNPRSESSALDKRVAANSQSKQNVFSTHSQIDHNDTINNSTSSPLDSNSSLPSLSPHSPRPIYWLTM